MKPWLRQLALLSRLIWAAAPLVGPRAARKRWPRVRGKLKAPGLRGPVEIVRDAWGVPHIYANDEHDLIFAQGYVHAQDRLWQLELGRRTADGRLGEVLGPAGLSADKLLRTLGLRLAAERAWALVEGEARSLAEAYAEGVNARIAGEPLPLEFAIFGLAPEPWTPVDTMARGNVLAYGLGGNHRLELLRARLLAEAGEEVTEALLPSHAPDTPLIVPPEARSVGGLKGLKGLEGLDGADALLGDPNIVSGSNNWAVHGRRTEGGKPLLANDVHVGLGLPSTFYENGLHGGRFDVVGFSLPGVPFVVIGHNGRIAWGMSNLGPDTQDFYLERLDDPKAPRRYEFRGEWRPLDVRRETIKVRGAAPVEIEVRSTGHGPLMNEAMGRATAGAEPMALRWALYECAPLVAPLIGINLAANFKDFRAALSSWESPGQNFVYADAEGNIAYQATGKVPVRAKGHQGVVPVPGWSGEYEWRGFIPFDELPASFNPPAGFVATANNKVTDDDYPHHIAHNWFPGYRAKRITDLLAAGEKHTAYTMRALQGETYSLPAEALRPHLLRAIEGAPAGALEARAREELRSWGLRFETDSVGATIFQAWYIALLRKLLGNRLGPELAERYLAGEYERHGSMHMPLVIGLMAEAEGPWFDDPKRPGRGSRDDAIRQCFAEAVAWLSERFGPNPEGWRWGDVHAVTYRHMPLGRAGPGWLRRAFNTKASPARGDNYSVDGASFLWSAPFAVVHGTALRMIVDLGDFSKSVGVHTPGQSEHLYHPHRDDLMKLSHGLEYHPILFDRPSVEAHAEATLVLEPAGGAPPRPR